MKKTIVIMLIIMLLFILVACTPQVEQKPDDGKDYDVVGGGKTPQLQIDDIVVYFGQKPAYVLPRFVDGVQWKNSLSPTTKRS